MSKNYSIINPLTYAELGNLFVQTFKVMNEINTKLAYHVGTKFDRIHLLTFLYGNGSHLSHTESYLSCQGDNIP